MNRATVQRLQRGPPNDFEHRVEVPEAVMNRKLMTVTATVFGTTLFAGVASAQEPQAPPAKDEARASTSTRDLPPAKDAVELTIGTGYAQGFGDVASNHASLKDTSTAGGAVQVGVGYRIIPHLTLGVYGTGAMFGRGDMVGSSANLYSATAGVQADWHFLPTGSEWDPWVSLGTGWRGYWVNDDQGTTALHGWEIAKLQVGVDYRISPAISISPVVGADVSTFFTESTPQSGGFASLSSPTANTFVFGGLMGRFDVPTRPTASGVAAR
jgi:outer membrane protein W